LCRTREFSEQSRGLVVGQTAPIGLDEEVDQFGVVRTSTASTNEILQSCHGDRIAAAEHLQVGHRWIPGSHWITSPVPLTQQLVSVCPRSTDSVSSRPSQKMANSRRMVHY